MWTPEGFPGQRLRVLPGPLVRQALTDRVTSRLLVTDSGYYPHAVRHGMKRSHGCPEAIVILCIDGSGSCLSDHQILTVSKGTALVIPPHVPHLYRADVADPWTIWWFHAAGADIAHLVSARQPAQPYLVEVHDIFRATAAIERVVEYMERNETRASLLSAAGSAWGLFAQLAADQARGRPGTAQPIEQALTYLHENFTEDVTVPDLARMAGLSRSHFATMFRSATGHGVIEYVKRQRMARARELLLTTTMSVSEISRAVGYADPFYFSRQFHKVNDCSPTSFRTHKSGNS